MTVRQMRALMADMPDDTRFIFEVGLDEFLPVCGRDSGWMDIYPADIEEEDITEADIKKFIVLRPCNCSTKDEVIPNIETFAEN
jgi:hypothetical protein